MSASYVDGKPQFRVLELPVDTAVPGPEQVHGNMTSIPQARQELTQFKSDQSDVVYGNLLSLPVADGMLYVEPLYLKTKGDNSYPFLRKVLVSYQKYVAYADNLTDGLKDLVRQATGQSIPPTTGTSPPTSGNPPSNTGNGTSPAVAAAVAAMDKALADLTTAQKSGDPEAYGKALKALMDAVAQYKAAEAAATPKPSTPASPGPAASSSPTPSTSTSPPAG
jgi:uncharacterized membrane protein (UPF0182 family)